MKINVLEIKSIYEEFGIYTHSSTPQINDLVKEIIKLRKINKEKRT